MFLSIFCLIVALVLFLIATFPALVINRISPLALGLAFLVLGGFILPRFGL